MTLIISFGIKSTHETWNLLCRDYLNNNLCNAKKLYLIRLLFYLGFYKQGLEVCTQVFLESSDVDNKIWAQYLFNLGQSILIPNQWSLEPFISKIDAFETKVSAFLFFHVSLLCAKFYTRYSKDLNLAQKWLNKASMLIEQLGLTKNDANLAHIRLQKYKADFYFRIKESQTAISLLQSVSDTSNTFILKINADSCYSYLFKEAKRRVLDALILYYYRSGDTINGFKYAQESISIDLYCSYAHLLIAKITTNIDLELSKFHFAKASEYGIIERPYAKLALATQFQGEHSLKIRDLEAEATDGKIFLMPQENFETTNRSLKLPIEINFLGEIANSYSEQQSWEKIKETVVYQRSLPFWEIRQSSLKLPIFCSGPLVALESFTNTECPWFKTLYLQRAMPINFREDLIFAVAPHILFATLHQSKAINFEVLQGRSNESEMILSFYQNISTLPKLKRILLCRLLGSLGVL